MPTLSDALTGLEFKLEKYPGHGEDDFLARRMALREALREWGELCYQRGYGDGMRDVHEAAHAAERHARERESGDSG